MQCLSKKNWNTLLSLFEFLSGRIRSGKAHKRTLSAERRAELQRFARKQQLIIKVSSWRFYNQEEEVLNQKSLRFIDRVVFNNLAVGNACETTDNKHTGSMIFSFFLLVSKTDKPLGDFTVQNQLVKLICWQAFSFLRFFNCFFLFSFQAEINVFQRWIPVGKSHHGLLTLKRRDVVFNQSGKGMKSEIDIWLILTNHYFHAQNLSVRNEENNGLLAGVPSQVAQARNMSNGEHRHCCVTF